MINRDLLERYAAEIPVPLDNNMLSQFQVYAGELIGTNRRYNLTAKEAEVLTEILKGQNAEEIAEAQFITKRTVRFHISNLLRKTGNKTQIAMIAHFHQTADDGVQLETEEKKSGVV